MRDDQADDDQTDTTHTCCGVSRNAHRQWSISQPVHLALAILVLLCGVLAGIFLFVDVGLHRVTLSTVTSNGHTSSSIVASIFSSLACLLSAHQIYQHRHHWTHPASQRYIERILLLVPVYACSACLGLVFLDASSYFDFLRTAYEAYAIWYVGGHEGVTRAMLTHQAEQHWPTPVGWCLRAPVTIDDNFVQRLKDCTLQYSFVAPLCAFVAVVATKAGHYEEGVFALDNVYVYTTIVINCSQCMALYCLVWLYQGIQETIAPFHPLPKFLSVKFIVFCLFWQSVLIAALVHWGVIHDGTQFDAKQIQVGLQDLLVCIEMFCFACAHYYVFPASVYADGSEGTRIRAVRKALRRPCVNLATIIPIADPLPSPSQCIQV